MALALRGARVLIDAGFEDGLTVAISDELIRDILPDARAADMPVDILPPGSLLVPGFIDVQVNGGGGVLFNESPTAQAALAIAAAHRRFGTTSLLPTLITDRPEAMGLAFAAAREAAARPDGGVLGLHLEGPFISPRRPGVHDPAHIRAMQPQDAAWLAGLAAQLPEGRILLTLAPEEVDDAMLTALAAAGVVLSAGHTAAGAARIVEALGAGLRARPRPGRRGADGPGELVRHHRRRSACRSAVAAPGAADQAAGQGVSRHRRHAAAGHRRNQLPALRPDHVSPRRPPHARRRHIGGGRSRYGNRRAQLYRAPGVGPGGGVSHGEPISRGFSWPS